MYKYVVGDWYAGIGLWKNPAYQYENYKLTGVGDTILIAWKVSNNRTHVTQNYDSDDREAVESFEKLEIEES